ncbi:MAG: hypothetical protein AVDCRST_MAG93-1559 [uncultured Chloroflexia bacterium]|uniref:CopG-like ribbon-helix-helix domain-containing protein n=1 Tax=uncultured Chloroflexia bacterium TaxID=1672391 RepID=A0A6J4IAH7_9CHLR|nr:MAG: hypothetical protein AVDCRST_MAG93-1559 [uncultured Chloroflexia bacterium]
MRCATVALPDELKDALETYRRSQEVPLALTAMTQAALQEYLERRRVSVPPSPRSRRSSPSGR